LLKSSDVDVTADASAVFPPQVGSSNSSIIMRACDTTGRLLSPDRPAAAIDAHFVYLAGLAPGADGEIWLT